MGGRIGAVLDDDEHRLPGEGRRVGRRCPPVPWLGLAHGKPAGRWVRDSRQLQARALRLLEERANARAPGAARTPALRAISDEPSGNRGKQRCWLQGQRQA